MLKKIILTALIISAVCFSGCGNNGTTETATPDSVNPTVAAQINNAESVDDDIEQVILEKGLKLDKDGNVTDSEGNNIKSEDGKIKITKEDGKTVEIDTAQVKAVTSDTGKSNSSESSKSTSKTSTASSSTNKNSSSSSSNNGTSSSKTESSSNTSNKNNSSTSSSSSKSESSKVWHEAVYKTVNHPAETKKVWVVDKAAYTYEEPIYEEQGVILCNDCNADVTDLSVRKQHIFWAANGENGHIYGSYRVDTVNVQVGTKTVEVPEEGHWETKVVKEAWTEKVLVKEAGYY